MTLTITYRDVVETLPDENGQPLTIRTIGGSAQLADDTHYFYCMTVPLDAREQQVDLVKRMIAMELAAEDKRRAA